MRSSRVVRASYITANAEVATVLGSIPASSEAVKSEGRLRKQCRIKKLSHLKKTFVKPMAADPCLWERPPGELVSTVV
jgi:hypothetical protein